MGSRKQKTNHLGKNRNIAIHVAIFLFYVFYFRLVIDSGLSADDMWNSNILAAPFLNGPSPLEVMWNQLLTWLKLGRVFPFSNYAALLFSFCPSVPVYKAFLVGMTYLDNLICSFCVKRITRSESVSFLSMLITPVLMQLTPEFDSGLYCYHGLIQLVVLDCFLSLWFLLKFIDDRKKRYAFGSAFCFWLALGTYEAAFPFILVLVWTAWREIGGLKGTLKTCMPNLLVCFAMGLANVCARLFLQENQYQGIMVDFSPARVFLTFFKQCATCIPLGRYLCSGLKYCVPYSEVYPYHFNEWIMCIRPLDLVSNLLFLVIVVLIGILHMKNKTNTEKDNDTMEGTPKAGNLTEAAAAMEEDIGINYRLFTLMGVGLLVFLLPGILIAISAKYQQTLGWCGGHLPAYMQSIGFGLLVTGFFVWLWIKIAGRRLRQMVNIGFMAVLFLVMLMNQISGRAAVEYMNGFRKYPQENVTRAGEAGFFDEVANQDKQVLVGTTAYIYDTNDPREFYSKFTMSHIEAVSREELLDQCIQTFGFSAEYDISLLSEAEYWGIFNQAERKEGAIILGRCRRVAVNEAGTDFSHVWIENPHIFLYGNKMNTAPATWKLIKSGKDYQIYETDGIYDIMQEETYYQDEAGKGVLYREGEGFLK